MITPRTTRLVRVPDLQAMHAAIARLACARPQPGGGVGDVRATAVIVPTKGAAESLRRTLEAQLLGSAGAALVLPEIVTRGDLYIRLHARIPGLPPLLSEFEREVLFRRAALDASGAGAEAPFALRAGLIVEILAFYDELRRRDKTVDAFERLMLGSLEASAGIDRGAERLLRLTHFLAAAFREFERRIGASGRLDEHALRAALSSGGGAPELQRTTAAPYRHVVVTVPDQAADPRGLWMADFDLLARMAGVEQLDVLATEQVLASGFHQRIHDALPGIDEERWGTPSAPPVLVIPERPPEDEAIHWYVCRDREEELVEAARLFKPARDAAGRAAIVFQRPLPYLYLARQVFTDARLPYRALDALPLAAEPFAAALDILFSFILTEATRGALVELLGSPHWSFVSNGRAVTRQDVRAAAALLHDVKYLGGWDRLASLAAEGAPALEAAASAARELAPMREAASASSQVDALLAFIRAHERLPMAEDAWGPRHLRARAAVLAALESLRDAHARHDDTPLPLADLAGAIRRWIEGQTFSPRTGTHGVTFMDAPAAAYADIDELRVAGLVETDWPERTARSIFYPSSLLLQLGWPADADRLAAARARFHDLLALPRRRVSVSTFTLEDDAIVSPSPFLEELGASGLPVERAPVPPRRRIFVHEAMADEPVVPEALEGVAAGWLAVRAGRSPDGGMFHGGAGARAASVYAVSHVERYLECPFKYFAGHVLKLREERDEESGLTPQERGQFLHDVFETFFREWQAAGRGSITTANVAEAASLFARVADTKLATLPEADRALERTHLLGSAAAPGLAERAFTFEIEQGGTVVERLLEHPLEGEFAFTSEGVTRRVRLRAKADRIDLMADGTVRLIDYKLSKAPKPGRALQLPVYGVCAEQALAGRHGRAWTLGRAGYVAFREKNPFSALGASSSLPQAVAEGQERFLAAVDAIERGDFPPAPDEPFICTRCGYAQVCRKDYVGDD